QFTWRDGRTWSYDHQSIIDVVVKNYLGDHLGIFPCEPGWVFSWCNTIGAEGVKGYDSFHRSSYFDMIEPSWREGIFGEMLTPNRAIRHIRSTLFGITFRDGDNPGETYTTGWHGLVDTAPDMARRGRLLLSRGLGAKLAALHPMIQDGVLAMR